MTTAPLPRNRQRKLALLLGSTLFTAGAALLLWGCQRSNAPLATVPQVDLARYTGTWYEIARLPQRFEKGCHCVTAQYAQHPDGYIEVRNSCRKDSPNGKLQVAKGKAYVVEGSGNSKLRVQFFWPFRGDYWILELDPEYRWAVVGAPNREYLWVLSRTPVLAPALLKELVQRQQAKGFPVDQLEYTDQSCR